MDLEDILARMNGILAASEGRALTDSEVTEYEGLERQLVAVRRSEEIRNRDRAYRTPVPAGGVPVAPRTDAVVVDGELERAFENYLRTGRPNDDLTALQVRAEQGEGSSAGGGYTVPAGFRQRLVEVMKDYGGFAPHADSFSTDTGVNIEYPTLDDTANEGAITNENNVVASGADLVFGSVNIGAYSYTSAGAGSNLPLRVPWELLQDSAFDVAGLVARAMGTRIARAQASDWITGTGVNQPKGIVAASLTADADLDTPDTVTYVDLVDLQDLLDEAYEQNAQWLMRKQTWSMIRKIVDTAGRPIVQDSTAGIASKPPKLLLGSNVIIDQAMPTLSSAGDTFPIAYGDYREAYVVRRVTTAFSLVVNPWTRASYRQTEFTAWQRADGTIQNRGAYKILANNT